MLAALLGALSLFHVTPAQAQATVWSATLTVKNFSSGAYGCNAAAVTACATLLTDSEFTYNARDYSVLYVGLVSGSLTIILDSSFPQGLTLHVDSNQFAFANAMPSTQSVDNDLAVWENTGLSWTMDQEVSLSFTPPVLFLKLKSS